MRNLILQSRQNEDDKGVIEMSDDKYRVHSKYLKHQSKPYLREIIDKYTDEVCHSLYFDHYPSWNEIINEVKRLDSLNDASNQEKSEKDTQENGLVLIAEQDAEEDEELDLTHEQSRGRS